MTGPPLRIRSGGGEEPHVMSAAELSPDGRSSVGSTSSASSSSSPTMGGTPRVFEGAWSDGATNGRHSKPQRQFASLYEEDSTPPPRDAFQSGVRRVSPIAVPLSKARDLLLEAVRGLPVTPSHGQEECYVRLEVEVTDVESEEDALVWLRGQSQVSPRIYFRVPDRSLVVAGAGACHLVSGPGDVTGERYRHVLSMAPPGMVYYGGGRFDAEYGKPAAEWEGFGGCYFVLPAVELIRRPPLFEGPPPTPPLEEKAEAGPFVLACNLRTLACEEREGVVGVLRGLAMGEDEEGSDCPLPAPVSCEEPAHFEAWTDGITRALDAMKAGEYRKVVLARAALFTFPCMPRSLDIVLRLRDHYGYLFCIMIDDHRAFLGCTPEQLFRIEGETVVTEALAGTRPRGSTAEEDAALAEELLASSKDRFENLVTAEFIEEQLRPLSSSIGRSEAAVLQLRHVQHIRHKITATLHPLPQAQPQAQPEHDDGAPSPAPPPPPPPPPPPKTTRRAFDLLSALHPTPAVCGTPRLDTKRAIRALEMFDRGFYAGPIGYVSRHACEFAVALRSVLVVRERARVFAGAGIVPGSTAEGEWAEVGAKMQNFVRMFPSPPPPLRNLPNLATLWATLTIEELVRNGVTHFCVAPGSRSTPLVVAAARHPRTQVVVHHDERGAGFYAVGYARATGGRPAAVIVTSGTAVANLLPAVVEASTDSVPLLLLTADRPPEARDCGANQTVTQPGIFGPYARWCRDMPCPTPDILVTSLLSDVDYAVSRARGGEPGPVHLNFMFRENLAPDPGPVRDSAVPDATSEWSDACLRDRRLAMWERSLRPYTTFPLLQPSCALPCALLACLRSCRRGLLLLGRLPSRRDRAYARWLAQALRWPVFADIQSGLRRDPALLGAHLLVPLYDTILADPSTSAALDPDLILQLGSPLVSKRLPKWAASSCSTCATLVHVTPGPSRRDPELAATFALCASVPNFVSALDAALDLRSLPPSGLLPLLTRLGAHLDQTVACKALTPQGPSSPSSPSPPPSAVLTEPMVAHIVSSELCPGSGLFLSNSMPVRDVDAYAGGVTVGPFPPLNNVAVNRGASGIDGVLSTALGYGVGLCKPVTLLIGDMALLHDLNALYALRNALPLSSHTQRSQSQHQQGGGPSPPVCVVLVNNGGGGIFSFLPIAAHSDVFESLFAAGHDLAFADACRAFGLSHELCLGQAEFLHAYRRVQAQAAAGWGAGGGGGGGGRRVTVLEVVTDRGENVRVHRDLTSRSRAAQQALMLQLLRLEWASSSSGGCVGEKKPTLLLLHGFLGCKEDWAGLLPLLGRHFHCLLVDLPGHGLSAMADAEVAKGSSTLYSMPMVALALVRLLDGLGVSRCAVLGYSMGGRLAAYLAREFPDRVSALVLLSAHLGLRSDVERIDRWQDDCRLSERVEADCLDAAKWDAWLRWWYSKPLWGRLAERSQAYQRMMSRRRACFEHSLDVGGMARSLLGMSLARQPPLWDGLRAAGPPMLWMYGAADSKYAALAEEVRSLADGASRPIEVRCVEDAGHALLSEKEAEVGTEALAFLRRHLSDTEGGIHAATTSSSTPSPSTSPSSSCLPVPPLSLSAGRVVRVSTVAWRGFSATLHKPLLLCSGPMAKHRGLLLTITSEAGVVGVGEVSPLPGFSAESLEAAELQLQHDVAPLLRHQPLPSSPSSLPSWLSTLASGRKKAPPGTVPLSAWHPSVRCGVEMALLHLLAQEHQLPLASLLSSLSPPSPTPLTQASHVHINALLGRGEEAAEGEGGRRGVVKVKVGGGPVEEDLTRVNGLLAHPGARLRLDANRAWTLPQGVQFVRGLSRPEAVEYIEEPLQDPLQLPELYRQAQRAVRFALDESLATAVTWTSSCVVDGGVGIGNGNGNGRQAQSPSSAKEEERAGHSVDQLLALEGLAAAVLKPTMLGGVSRCLDVSLRARARGLSTVITSSFESSVGLCHLAALASVTGRFGGPSVAHGIGTYALMGEAVVAGSGQRLQGFELCVMRHGAALVCDVAAAQRLLDNCARGIGGQGMGGMKGGITREEQGDDDAPISGGDQRRASEA